MCLRTVRKEIDFGESEFDFESMKQKYGFCKNYDDTLCFRSLRGEIDPGESEFDVECIKQQIRGFARITTIRCVFEAFGRKFDPGES